MTPQQLVIVGAGGHAREAFSVIAAINVLRLRWTVLGFTSIDAPHPDFLARLGATWIGASEEVALRPRPRFVVAIGDAVTRQRVALRYESQEMTPAALVHPSVVLGSGVSIGEGTIINQQVSISGGVAVGRHSYLNPATVLGADVSLGSGVSVNAAAKVLRGATVGSRTTLGVGCVIHPGVAIGSDVVVGAGAVVAFDVPDGVTVVGAPGRILER